MKINWRDVQTALKAKGFNPGPIDGDPGPLTDAAIVAFKRSVGLVPRPYAGPITLSTLLGTKPAPGMTVGNEPPWLLELAKHMGLHEVGDNAALRAWLASDGATLGDPAKLPWCGDAMETAIKLTLPGEPFPGNLGINPYWARNWTLFGKHTDLCYGAIAPFARPGGGGHIAALVGISKNRRFYRVRGGNQSNRVSDTWIEADRCLDTRWPVTWSGAKRALPVMNSDGAILSTNEA